MWGRFQGNKIIILRMVRAEEPLRVEGGWPGKLAKIGLTIHFSDCFGHFLEILTAVSVAKEIKVAQIHA